MLIIGLNGSPNKNGSTKALLQRILFQTVEHGAQTQIIEVPEIMKSAKHSFCIACTNPCLGVCYQGTAVEETFELLKQADGVVIGSPVYFGSMSGQIKAFFDKTRRLRGIKGLYNTVGAGVTVGNAKYGGQETTMKALHDMMLVHGMLVIGDGYIDDDCGHHGVCAQRPGGEDEFALKRADILAKRLVELCAGTKHLRASRNQKE